MAVAHDALEQAHALSDEVVVACDKDRQVVAALFASNHSMPLRKAGQHAKDRVGKTRYGGNRYRVRRMGDVLCVLFNLDSVADDAELTENDMFLRSEVRSCLY